jgi:hypothetical protein
MAAMPKFSLWGYSATIGSLSTATGGFISLLAPSPWDLLVWAVSTAALCTGMAQLADRFVCDGCGDVYHRYDDDPLICTLDRGHGGKWHRGQGAEWPVGHEFGDRRGVA